MNHEKQIINKKYYQDLSKFDILTNHEIKDLYILINQNDKTAFNKIITSNLKLVVHFAKQYKSILQKSDAIELDDLISEGNIGLMEAARRYNSDFNVKFSYYASFWIKRAITEFIIKAGSTIRSPHNKIMSDNKIAKAVNELYQKNQYEVFENDIEALNQFSTSEINHYFFSKPNTVRIEDETNINCPFDIEESDIDEKKNKLKHYMEYLNPQERKVIRMLYNYGSEQDESMTTQQVSEELNLTRQRINEIKLNALKKLKEKTTSTKKMNRYELLKKNETMTFQFVKNGILSSMILRDIEIYEAYNAIDDDITKELRYIILGEKYELSVKRIEQIIYNMNNNIK
ncbi:sigma-70 family RNA polymerase sigma factor [Flavobacterium hibernum]|uniref:RNA polymerase sigma-70 domain-containing protein n=1 Tax=Flavobacterium hibernum TaxID=37752 RepID=A0A0D0EJD3_9FLAO|nr:sigma-70 family RNA polymerase sigma factor [Flavobacterium hibernum]KIO50960.1 hypothetical protein IW18_20465 [Flavobacterium hibernum]OXA85204.1 hypothetical protein B0A73_17805 [Flavobacterium hibernum]STO11344.1 RNA polymerase sigma factor rpoD [Flavobacterium hibernum]